MANKAGMYSNPITAPVQGYRDLTKKNHTAPLTWVDQYGVTQHAENQAQKNQFTQMQQNKYLRGQLAQYDANASPYLKQLQQQFGQQVQYGIGQASGNVMAGINQFLSRRGIDPRRGGIGASLQAQQLGALQQQGAQAQMSFSNQLLQHLQTDRNAVLTGTLSFFQALDKMNYNNELNKNMLDFQQNIQRDNARWQALGSVLGLGGQVLTGMFGVSSGMPDTSQLPGEMQTMSPIYGSGQ